MKSVLAIFLLFSTTCLYYSQTDEVYYNGSRKIDKLSYNATKNSSEFFKFSYLSEDSTTTIYRIEKTIVSGTFDKDTLSAIRKDLQSSSKIKIPETDVLVLNYYPGKDKCNSVSNISFEKKQFNFLIKQLQFKEPTSQFFVYRSKEGLERYGKIYDWIADKNQRIYKLLFNVPYPCGSSIIIFPDGNYIFFRGDYYVVQLLSKLKEN